MRLWKLLPVVYWRVGRGRRVVGGGGVILSRLLIAAVIAAVIIALVVVVVVVVSSSPVVGLWLPLIHWQDCVLWSLSSSSVCIILLPLLIVPISLICKDHMNIVDYEAIK